MIHVYAFADRLRALPALAGVDDARLEQVCVDGVTTVFSRRARPSAGEALRADVVRHGAVVEALMDVAAAVLPVRFGEGVRDDGELGRSVATRADELRRRFESVRGCVEIGLRVWSADAPLANAASGADYMRRRQALEAERRTTVGELDRALRALAREARVDGAPLRGREMIGAAYLVPRTELDAVRAVVDAFASTHDGLTVVCTGPWAPFSFASEAA